MSLAFAKSIFTAPARSSRASQILALVVGTFLLSASLWAQGAAGRISGTITDQSGGAIPAAKVTVTNVERNDSRVLTTDTAGAYAAPNLTPGTYVVHAEFMGFKAAERNNLKLEVSQDMRVDLSMQPGEQTQTVTVTGEAAVLNTTNAEVGGTLSNQVINDLPLNGRNFENLLDLRPGVTKYPGNAGWTQATNGLRPHDNFFLVDGINSNDPWMAQSMMNAVMAAGDAGTMLPIDAIDEFKTNQNPRAEYGWKPGAVVNVGVKSGSNAFHGTAYAYGRTDAWDANNFFSNAVGQPLPPLSLEQYGASLGGRIIRDKLFFFGNFESQQYQVGAPFNHSVPITTPGATDPTQSLAGACNAARTAGKLTALSAQLAGLSTNCTPLANYPGLFPASANGTYTTALASSNSIFSGVGKLDYRINDKNSINGMFFMSPGSGTFVDNAPLRNRPAVADHSICPFASYVRKLDLCSHFQHREFPAGWSVPLPPDLRNPRCHAKSCQLLLQWRHLQHVHRADRSHFLWLPPNHHQWFPQLSVGRTRQLAQDRRTGLGLLSSAIPFPFRRGITR